MKGENEEIAINQLEHWKSVYAYQFSHAVLFLDYGM